VNFSTAELDAYCSSGPSPTVSVHLLGVGAVGQAWLQAARHGPFRVVGVTDRQATVRDDRGLPLDRLILHKQCGQGLDRWMEAAGSLRGHREPAPSAALVIDATPSEASRGPEDRARIRRWLARGQSVALASKHALAADPGLLHHRNLGANAVLGGTGARLQAELPELCARWQSVALAGSATATSILEVLGAGGTFAEGLQAAASKGVLEPDPELDLRGLDAALKLAIVGGALLGRTIEPHEIEVQDLRTVDPAEVRKDAARGWVWRLVGRASREGGLTLRCEALPPDSPLAITTEEVAYVYTLPGEVRAHRGQGLGAQGTAAALHQDVLRLSRRAA
jgi:homoserine dehydrogenase